MNSETPFSVIYDAFLSKVTDDMYMEMSEHETFLQLEELLLSALPYFEFPRVKLADNYTLQEMVSVEEQEGVESDYIPVPAYIWQDGRFFVKLSDEEVNIIAVYMMAEWISRQIATVENIRQKYSNDDFKFTSQANHISKLVTLKEHYKQEGFHLQRLYKRRKPDENGIMRSTFNEIMEQSVRGDGFYDSYKI